MSNVEKQPIVVIGAGPVGMAAAAHLVARGLTPLVLERGTAVGSSLMAWGHVRVFSPWEYNIDGAARSLLQQRGWKEPDARTLPTGGELVREYLEPLAQHPEIAPNLVFGADVTAISRAGFDKMTSAGREIAPFTVRWRDASGAERQTQAGAVIDASGTWDQPNPLGVDGLPVPGEKDSGGVAYGIPDVRGQDRSVYAGRRVLVVGSGHSAINVALDLLELQSEAPDTRIFWALRRNRVEKLFGGGTDDQLAARGALGLAAKRAVENEKLVMLAPFAIERLEHRQEHLIVHAKHNGAAIELAVDRIIVAAGFRPNLEMLRELRVSIDPAVESPPALAPLIDPNVHSCGTVRPHGARELAHPDEPGFYIVGSKSYGRAPTFLMATGYEQVRSVVAEIAGDHAAARDIRLVLPETGVCSVTPAAVETVPSACCGPTVPAAAGACCGAAAEVPAETTAAVQTASCRRPAA